MLKVQQHKKIFKNYTLKINHGDKIALIGANGVGKTTLCNLINGILKPQSFLVWNAIKRLL